MNYEINLWFKIIVFLREGKRKEGKGGEGREWRRERRGGRGKGYRVYIT